MQVGDYLQPGNIILEMQAKDKRHVIQELVRKLVQNGQLREEKKTVRSCMEREKLGSTAIGYGIAIPHTRSGDVEQIQMAMGISKSGVNYQALDNELTHLFFLLIVPKESMTEHLRLLSHISCMLLDPAVRRQLLAAETPEQVQSIIRRCQTAAGMAK